MLTDGGTDGYHQSIGVLQSLNTLIIINLYMINSSCAYWPVCLYSHHFHITIHSAFRPRQMNIRYDRRLGTFSPLRLLSEGGSTLIRGQVDTLLPSHGSGSVVTGTRSRPSKRTTWQVEISEPLSSWGQKLWVRYPRWAWASVCWLV